MSKSVLDLYQSEIDANDSTLQESIGNSISFHASSLLALSLDYKLLFLAVNMNIVKTC